MIPEDHDVTKALEDAYKNLFGNERIGVPATEEMRKARPLTDKWTFSTNGVSIMGRNGIPCIGFGPGAEAQAHAPNEIKMCIRDRICPLILEASMGVKGI